MSRDAVARARACIGTRFRPQGRLPGQGLDCVGVAMIAAAVPAWRVRRDYRLRARFEAVEQALAGELAPVPADGLTAGDVLLVDAGAGRPHLVVLSPEGYVHADAGVGRVVEVPGAPPWAVRSAWRRGG